MKTIHDRLIASLTDLGAHIDPKARTSKYTVLIPNLGFACDKSGAIVCTGRSTTAPDKKFYIGPAGALRRGPTVATSVPVDNRIKQYLLERLQ